MGKQAKLAEIIQRCAQAEAAAKMAAAWIHWWTRPEREGPTLVLSSENAHDWYDAVWGHLAPYHQEAQDG